jgi:hypothetical protein
MPRSAAMASPSQIARASYTSSSIVSAAVEEGFARPGSDTVIPHAFRDNWRQALQPSALAECRKINSGRGIPSRRAIAGAKLHRDILVAVRNPQWCPGYGIRLGGS